MNKILLLAFGCGLLACSGRKSATTDEHKTANMDSATTNRNTFNEARHFLQEYHHDLIELKAGDAQALICPAYQGRVMTSTADGQASYGWINYELIQSKKILPHMNAFGGEDRFWLGPEGGQFALYFKKGDPFDGEHWQTPAAIDSEPFTLTKKTETSATFTRQVELVNYSGSLFNIGIERTVSLVSKPEIDQLLGEKTDSLKVVGVRSDNVITNKGAQTWSAKTGLPSIWILGMMNASPATTVIVPFQPGAGQPINDSYFGKLPAERLIIGERSALFKADANYRSKIGVAPARATKWLGSYDPGTKTLTLVTYTFDSSNKQYVNSAWELQKEPFSGDVLNAYNDGPMKPGQPQMGKFYEMESSSPAAALAPSQSMQHQHTTIHLQGPESQLDKISQRLLLTRLETIEQ
ncbi:hypothetical protein G8759_08320 [Spirosoma aureum]|uniref:Lipoprotein n=1 Tax=Spirosoma aureum TaxID=2692134 RepID=A0A6G9AJY2_9BACT|nr:DUF6786 family protein [Spirosoma aureum]QIP12626.1 hypothetical protein G8759_08320 [Spirosoma aureum]